MKLIQFKPTSLRQGSERRKTNPAEVVVFTASKTGTSRNGTCPPPRTIVIDQVRDRIVRSWDRGVFTRQLAKMYRIDRLEVERIVHEQRNQFLTKRKAA